MSLLNNLNLLRGLLSRLFQTALVIFILMTLTFFILRNLPGGPFDSENAETSEVRAQMESFYHLDRPLIEQYGIFLKELVSGNLGTSYRYLNQDTGKILRESVLPTLELGLMALILALLVGVPLGIMASRSYLHTGDKLILIFTTFGLSIPSFLLAPILILAFSFWWNLLPPALWDGPTYYILPVITLAFRPTAEIIRLVRNSALEILSSDFVRAARARGVSETTLFFKHVLRNSLIPLLGIFGPLVAHLLSGSFVVELLYAIPGLGHHFVDSVLDRDYPLILTLTLFYGIVLSLANLLADLLSLWVDPQVKSL